MTNAIQISASSAKARESGALASVESGEPSQIVEGKRAQTMAFCVVEQPCQFLGRRLDSGSVDGLHGVGAFQTLRHASPVLLLSLAAHADSAT